MWPRKLDLNPEECNALLREIGEPKFALRIFQIFNAKSLFFNKFSYYVAEVDCYSSVITAFRAQGGLDDLKVKILSDLRNIFHIDEERHKAEARRVANDEELITIADT